MTFALIRRGFAAGVFMFLALAGSDAFAQTLNFITPVTAPAGSQALTLTVTGSGFTNVSTVVWNGTALATTFSGPGQLSATVPSNLLVSPGQASVYVRNPNGTQSTSLTFTILAALAISTASLPAATAGVAYSVNLSAVSGTAPYVWQADSLPPGLALSSTGALTGTPTTAGTYTVNFRVSDAAQGSATKSLQLTVNPPPFSINQASPLPSATAGQPYTTTLSATGGTAPLRWSATGALPEGLTLNATTGTLSGTPAAVGSFDFTIQVTDNTGASATRQFTIQVRAAPIEITTLAPLFEATSGTPYAQPFSASGGVLPYRWSIRGQVPGLTFDANSGTLQGTPTTTGTFTVTVEVVDRVGTTASKTYTLTVNPPTPVITTSSPLPPATVGVLYSQTFSAIRVTPPAQWTIVSGFVPGLTLNPGTGVLSETPISAGTYTFTVEVRGSDNAAVTRTFTLTVNPGRLSIVGGPQTFNGRLSDPFSQTLTASGGTPPYTWSANGLPEGLRMETDGRITGTPTAAGTFSFTVRVIDAAQAAFTDLYRIVIDLPPIPGLSFSSLPDRANPAEQTPVRVSLDAPYTSPVTGQVFLGFAPETGTGDSTVQFSSGGRVANFQIPAGEMSAVFDAPGISVQTGTVAGTITLTVRIQSSGIDLTPADAPRRSIRIDRSAPVIVSTRIQRGSNTIDVEVVGYSTTREITQAVFRFGTTGDNQLLTSEVTVPVESAFKQWFDDAASVRFGSQFKFVQRFTVQGDVNAVRPQSVALTNRTGTTSANITQ